MTRSTFYLQVDAAIHAQNRSIALAHATCVRLKMENGTRSTPGCGPATAGASATLDAEGSRAQMA